MDEKEINDRLKRAIVRFGGTHDEGSIFFSGAISLHGRFSAANLRELANAIDKEDECTAAMIHDLKEESAAYQRGLKDGERQGRESVWDDAQRETERAGKCYQSTVTGPVIVFRKDGEDFLVKCVETPEEQVRKERETMQTVHDLVHLAWRKTFHLEEPERGAWVDARGRAQHILQEYERDRTERLSGPAGR